MCIQHVVDWRIESVFSSVSYCHETEAIASASEDGTVRLWDAKKKKANVATITPSERPSLARPNLGKWVGAVSVTQDWIVSTNRWLLLMNIARPCAP